VAEHEDIGRRAVLLSRLPGVRLAEVCARFDLSPTRLRQLRKAITVYRTRADLVLAALSDCGRISEGTIGALDDIAGYVDWQNHDGTTAADVASLLDALVADGRIGRDGDRGWLPRPWP
jgi:hypothetical protein